jgi:hypothetical protein
MFNYLMLLGFVEIGSALPDIAFLNVIFLSTFFYFKKTSTFISESVMSVFFFSTN